jgi:hypothetical protein
MRCFETVRADRYLPLEKAEAIHTDACLLNPESAIRRALA